MRDYGQLAPTFWTRGSGKKLRGHKDAQILALYLFSAPSSTMTGVFGLGLPVIAHETGLTVDEVVEAFAVLSRPDIDIAHYDVDAELVYVVRSVVYQVGDSLSSGTNGKEDNRVKSIRREIRQVGEHPFSLDFGWRYQNSHLLGPSPFEAPWKPLRRGFTDHERGFSRAGVQEQEQEQDLPPPSGAHAGEGVEAPVEEPPPGRVPASPDAVRFLACLASFPALSRMATAQAADAIAGLAMAAAKSPAAVELALAELAAAVALMPDAGARLSDDGFAALLRKFVSNAREARAPRSPPGAPKPQPTHPGQQSWRERNKPIDLSPQPEAPEVK